ncbi:hypothetical protein PsorP6_017405 [Peronosclerospora sorghi]|uniref:Uncharacterized protein n=1 Tax=Peronosclerospora sorghi TaxID=230839 RepID=A0ACC0WKW6_9STRA|nr:hypothetical protein PsorP6_017405 [Peronosclerospora sorghi]
MAKAIITSILEAQLGKYVDGLRSESLVVGLWSGELELRDLALKPNALAELQLPVAIASGSISRVLVRVPWNQLGSASVTITLEGVSVLVIPNMERAAAAELLQVKKNRLERRELMRQHGRFAARVASDQEQEKKRSTEDEGTFVSRLTARIIDNLQVTLVNVHLRYEDALANADAPFACGLMLERFRVFTTDGEGTEAFVDQSSGHSAFTYKKVELTQFGIYWDRLDVKDERARLERHQDIPKAMQKMVQVLSEEESVYIDRVRRWILRPCSLIVQLTKNESTDYLAVAKYTVEAEIGTLQGSLTREQYEDVLYLHRAFVGRRAVEAHFTLARGRPLHPPGARPRDWWDYATHLVLRQRRAKLRAMANANDTTSAVAHILCRPHLRKMRWSSVRKALLEQQLYMEAFRTEVRNGAPLDLTTRQGKLKQRYEEIYPIDVILLLRDRAEDAEERAQTEAKASAEKLLKKQDDQNGAGSWYSYFFGGDTVAGPSEEDEEGNVLSAEGRENLREAYNDAVEKSGSAHEVPIGCNLISLQIQLTNGSLALYQSDAHENPFVTGMFRGSLAVNIQPGNEWDAQFRVQHFEVLNGLAKDSRFRSFCSPSACLSYSDDPSAACLSTDISRRETKIWNDHEANATFKIRMSSEPIRVMVDPSFVVFLHTFFVSLLPEKQLEKVWQFATSSVADWMFADDSIDDAKQLESSEQKEAHEAELITSLAKAGDSVAYDVVLNMNAPVLILPENVADTTGAVVAVDLGMLSFRNEDKVTGREACKDVPCDIADDPRRLHWRLEMTKIHVSLGSQEQLIDWSHEEMQHFSKIVKDLSIEFALHTQASSSSRLPFLSRRKKIVISAKPLPQIAIYAAVPKIIISLAEKQLVALGAIHSSILQVAAQSKGDERRLSCFEEQELVRHEESSIEFNSESKSSDAVAATTDEKYLVEMQLSLGFVELNLRESATKDAFTLRASHTSFTAEVYSTHQFFNARLKALVMEDKLYSPDSRYYQLISTGENESETPHLIAVDVAMFSPESTEPRENNSQLEADIHFNVLHLQWNPSSVALFYRIVSAYASAVKSENEVFRNDSPSRMGSTLQPLKRNALETSNLGEKKISTAVLSSLRSRGQPLVVVRASLVQFSLTFNKDQCDRQLARFEMSDAGVNFTSYTVDKQTSCDDTFEVTGHVGNLVGRDLSTLKHPFYSTLLGLDEEEAHLRSSGGNETKALLTFEFASDPVASDKGSLSLAFQPIRGVYYHQQVLELVDFILEGVLGAIVSQTLANATQLLLREDEASVVLNVSVEKPTLVLPLSLQDAPHAKITADLLQLVHYPSSTVNYKRPPGARAKHVVHDEALARPIIRKSTDEGEDISLRVDCKDLHLKRLRIFCTATKAGKGKRTNNGEEEPVYEDLLANPADLKISIEDLVSSTISIDEEKATANKTDRRTVFLPRITVESTLPPLEIHLSRTSYMGIVALILENFGAEELQNTPSITENNEHLSSTLRFVGRRRSSASVDVPSLRPTVTYTYLQPDADEATVHVEFAMEKVKIMLMSEQQVNSPVKDSISLDSIVQDTLTNSTSMIPIGAFAEIVASDFSLAFDSEYHENPRFAVRLGAFRARNLAGKYKSSARGTDRGVFLVSPYPLQIRYTWDDIALTGELDLLFSEVKGSVIPEALSALLAFFALPSKPNRARDRTDSRVVEATNGLLVPVTSTISPSPSLVTRRESISDILRDGKKPELALTIRAQAKQIGVALPHDAYDPKSPRVVFAGDFTLEFTWKPHPNLIREKSDDDMSIQCTILADARNIEMVLENARRPGCCVGRPSPSAQWDAIDIAPLIQLLEPCDVHIQVKDLFPHAGRRQQIAALNFTPIEMFVSYEDVCLAMDTMESLNKAMTQHQRASDAHSFSGGDYSALRSLTRSRTSSRSLVRAAALEKEEIHRYFTCQLPSVNLTLINDCDGCDMGLAQLQIERCNVFLNVTHISPKGDHDSASASFESGSMTTTISGGGSLVVLISYYNPRTRDWHPMCTEWALDASIQGSISSESELHFILTAPQALDLTVNHGLLEVMASVGGAWKRRAASHTTKEIADDDTMRGRTAPCVIRNETGLPLSFWLTNGSFTTEPQVVPTGGLADVRYLHAPGRGRGVVRRYASGDRDAANLRLSLQLSDTKSPGQSAPRFQSIQGLIFEQLGARMFPLMDTNGKRTSFSLNLSAHLVEGRILLVVSSPIKLVNQLASGRPVALLVNDPTWHSPVEIGILRSNQDSAIPVLLSLASELRLRPAGCGNAFSWSAPIPVQTQSAVELKVEAIASSTSSVTRATNDGNDRNAVYCVLMTSEKDMRTVSVTEPFVLVNKLPVPLTYRVRSTFSSAYGSGTSDSPSGPETIAVGAKTSIWWTDIAQRPLFQLVVEGCTLPSKWLELAPRGTARGAVLSVQLSRVDDGRQFRLLLRIVGDTDHPATPVYVEFLADIWVINRSGLDLVYGTATDSEAYIPPPAARTRVGNAQISAYSSDNSGKIPVIRIGLRGCSWSARFEADPKRLSWQDECITLRSAGNTASSGCVLYELGVSADYATRHFGSVTTLVSVIPRYMILNRSQHTLLLLETSHRQLQRPEASSNDNVAHHVLGPGDMYALYWVCEPRALLRASVLINKEASDSICEEGYDWSEAFAVDRTGTTDLLVPPRASGRGVHLEVVVKRGSLSQATFLVIVADLSANSLASPSSRLSAAASLISSSTKNAVAERGWQTLSFHAQMAGVIITITDTKHGGIADEAHNLFSAGSPEGESEPVARVTLTRIGVEVSYSLQATAAKLNLMGLKVEDLLSRSKSRVVLRPLLRRDRASPSVSENNLDKHFLVLTYLGRPHAKYTWVERVHVELQNMKISTSMDFVDRLNRLLQDTVAHFQHKSLVSAPAARDQTADVTFSDDEFEVEFSGTSLGLVAKQSGTSVIVRECIPSSAAAASGRIAAGDCVLAVNGVSVANTSQFKSLVSKTPRPIVLRFRRQSIAAYDLFGELKQ